MLFILTLMHFAVDGVCAAELYLYELAEPDWLQVLFVFGLYNFTAFGFQWLAGLALDRHPAFRSALVLAVCLLGLGLVLDNHTWGYDGRLLPAPSKGPLSCHTHPCQ
jgi:MFS family permease